MFAALAFHSPSTFPPYSIGVSSSDLNIHACLVQFEATYWHSQATRSETAIKASSQKAGTRKKTARVRLCHRHSHVLALNGLNHRRGSNKPNKISTSSNQDLCCGGDCGILSACTALHDRKRSLYTLHAERTSAKLN